jgi:Zinc dependent phospholipase C
MPQPALHIILARRALERWRAQPDTAPFHPDAPGAETHFLHGALAPDMGFFPGADSFVSRIVHADGSARVARALLALSQTDAEIAFGWGWITHVLADVEIHPIVNEAAATLVRSERGDAGTLEDLSLAHTSVEVGVDAHYFHAHPEAAGDGLKHAFSRSRIEFVGRALQLVYGATFTPGQLLRWHRNVTRFYNAYLRLVPMIGADHGIAPGSVTHFVMRPLRFVGNLLLDRKAPARGFLYPTPAGDDILEEVDGAIVRFEAEFEAQVETGARSMPDHDLETGLVRTPVIVADPARAWAGMGRFAARHASAVHGVAS